MKKPILVLLTVAVIASGSAVAVVQGSRLDGAATASVIADRIENCTSGKFTPDHLSNEAVYDCVVEDVMRPMLVKGNFLNLNLALLDVTSEHRSFWMPCHEMMHFAADRVATSPQHLFSILRQLDTPVCQGGLVHGLLDSLPRLTPTMSDFQELGKVCGDYITRMERLDDKVARQRLGQLYAYCTDGAGHAAWATYEDLERAVAACGTMADAVARSNCAEGLIMQYFDPVNGKAVATVEEAFTELPRMCATWPDRTIDRDTAVGCNTGAGYIYTRPAWRLSQNYDIRSHADASAPVPADVIDGMLASVNLAIDTCLAHHTGDCLESISRQIPPNLYRDPDAVSSVCARLGEAEEYCLADANRRAGLI